MFIARVQVTATNEGRQSLVDTLSTEAGQIASMFEGCELFVVSVDETNQNTVMIAEEWSTKELFETYQTSEHFSETMAAVAPCLTGPPKSAYYEGERVGP